VALTKTVRSERVGTPPRAEYRASRLLALPLLSILIFCGGGFEKRNGRQRRGAASFWEKGRTGFKYKVVPRHAKFFKEWRGAKSVCVCPSLPCAHIIPAVFEEHYKTAGMAPLCILWNSVSLIIRCILVFCLPISADQNKRVRVCSLNKRNPKIDIVIVL